ncbi:MAG TPA: YetF domain-containing protein [Candidatus Limnocylindria bacterium]
MDIVLRATVIFVALYLLVRLMGKRELGQMTPFELIVLVVIGDLIQQGVTQNDFSVTGAIIAISTIAFLALVMSWATYLWPWAERTLEGEPRVIIQDGAIVEANVRRNMLTRAEIESEMRLAGIGRLSEVAWAILEPRGRVSFIQRTDGGEEPPPNPQNAEDSGAA